MCILSKLHYAKFGVSNLSFSKVIEEKPLGGRLDPPPPLVQEGLKSRLATFVQLIFDGPISKIVSNSLTYYHTKYYAFIINASILTPICSAA